jgi:tRNA threonylcarbamoyladenosine biosynthesis protein TsaE
VGESLRPGDLVGLRGELGSGKTTFVKGVALGLGIEEEVCSPTFAIQHRYAGVLPLSHVDLYRLSNSGELRDLDHDLLFPGDAAAVVEWADRFPGALPPCGLKVCFHHQSAGERAIELRFPADKERWTALGAHLRNFGKKGEEKPENRAFST